MKVEIKKIGVESAKTLSEVAVYAYLNHYKHLWYDEGAWYVEKCFNIKQLESELLDKNNQIFIVIFKDNPVGFLKLCPEKQLVEQNGYGFEIERIYLTRTVTGNGIGRKLMEFAIEKAKQLQKDYVWLKAMDSSMSAIRFYESLGFEICGTSRLDFSQMKNEYLGMVVMKKNL